jgi:hypothetical protein
MMSKKPLKPTILEKIKASAVEHDETEEQPEELFTNRPLDSAKRNSINEKTSLIKSRVNDPESKSDLKSGGGSAVKHPQ